MKIKSFRAIATLIIALCLTASAAFAMPATAAEVNSRYITASATGATTVVPDAVRINSMVWVLAKTSKEALAASSTTATAVRKALVANIIAVKDLDTHFKYCDVGCSRNF